MSAIGKHVTQPWECVANAGKQQQRAIAILNIGTMHDRTDQKAQRVSKDMTLAAVDHLLGGIAARAAGFSRLHR